MAANEREGRAWIPTRQVTEAGGGGKSRTAT